MIQLSRTGTRVDYTAEELDRLRCEFRASHYVVLPGILSPELLGIVTSRLERAVFQTRVYGSFGRDEWPVDPKTAALLNLICNCDILQKTVESITDCGQIGCFVGKVYRMVPGADHFDSWHDDTEDNRRIALSINLTPEPYEGGVLELRDRESKQVLSAIGRTDFGDGVIFRIADYLEHRRTPVTGSFAKTAFAGWFKAEPDFHQLLHEMHVKDEDGHSA